MNSNSPLLEIKDLKVSINDNEILKNLNLKKRKGCLKIWPNEFEMSLKDQTAFFI